MKLTKYKKQYYKFNIATKELQDYHWIKEDDLFSELDRMINPSSYVAKDEIVWFKASKQDDKILINFVKSSLDDKLDVFGYLWEISEVEDINHLLYEINKMWEDRTDTSIPYDENKISMDELSKKIEIHIYEIWEENKITHYKKIAYSKPELIYELNKIINPVTDGYNYNDKRCCKFNVEWINEEINITYKLYSDSYRDNTYSYLWRIASNSQALFDEIKTMWKNRTNDYSEL